MQDKKCEYIALSDNVTVPCDYSDGVLSIDMQGHTCEVDGDLDFFVSQNTQTNPEKRCYYHLQFPLEKYFSDLFTGNNGKLTQSGLACRRYNILIDYFIYGYMQGIRYSKMLFSFPELDSFISPVSLCQVEADTNEIYRESFKHKEKNVTITLYCHSERLQSDCCKCKAKTISELSLEFEETSDYSFLLSLFNLVKNVFSFLANRTNIGLASAKLIGIINESNYESTLFVPADTIFEDNPKILREIGHLCVIKSHLINLIQLISNDKVIIPIFHSSKNARNTYDLNKCLGTTASFEYYIRTFLPPMRSKTTETVAEEILLEIDSYIDKLDDKKKKKKAKELAKRFQIVSSSISLEDEICKVYKGYSTKGDTKDNKGWLPLDTILAGWFKPAISDLAKVANDWRNELAHCKRSIIPDEKVIDAIILIEHINYIIVLREAGYNDSEIRIFLSSIFMNPLLEELEEYLKKMRQQHAPEVSGIDCQE